jgi:hypothetical protein
MEIIMSTKLETTNTKTLSAKEKRSMAAKKAAATRKRNAANAAAKKEQAKTKADHRKEAREATSKVEEAEKVTAYTLESGAPYSAVTKDHTLFRGLTIAALVVAGFCQLTKSGMAEKITKGNVSLLRGLIGKSASGTWIGKGESKRVNTETGMLTPAGKKEISASFTNGKRSYRTTVAIVNAMIPAIRNGGKVTLAGENGGKVNANFIAKVSVMKQS